MYSAFSFASCRATMLSAGLNFALERVALGPEFRFAFPDFRSILLTGSDGLDFVESPSARDGEGIRTESDLT
jgi:hypothetical protein